MISLVFRLPGLQRDAVFEKYRVGRTIPADARERVRVYVRRSRGIATLRALLAAVDDGLLDLDRVALGCRVAQRPRLRGRDCCSKRERSSGCGGSAMSVSGGSSSKRGSDRFGP